MQASITQDQGTDAAEASGQVKRTKRGRGPSKNKTSTPAQDQTQRVIILLRSIMFVGIHTSLLSFCILKFSFSFMQLSVTEQASEPAWVEGLAANNLGSQVHVERVTQAAAEGSGQRGKKHLKKGKRVADS